jgi:hypothetical protein
MANWIGSGINAITYYSPTVFKSLGVTGTNTGFFTTGLFGVVKTALTLVWLFFLIDRLGRRKLLMIGAIGGSLCMWYIGAYISIAGVNGASDPNSKLTGAGISAIFFFYLWTAFYTPSWNGTPWVLNSEMFDQNVRALGQASAAASNWVCICAVNFFFWIIADNFPSSGILSYRGLLLRCSLRCSTACTFSSPAS